MQIILTTPIDLTPNNIKAFIPSLVLILETGLVRALLVQQGKNNDGDYQKILTSLIAVSQPKNCAILLQDHLQLVKKTGADGVHISSDHADFLSAIANLKPHFIVGAGNIKTRHAAMLAAEAGADYICFGDLDGTGMASDLELAQWFSELFQTPSMVFDQQTDLPEEGQDWPAFQKSVEFIGLGENLWNNKQPGEALIRLTKSNKISKQANH